MDIASDNASRVTTPIRSAVEVCDCPPTYSVTSCEVSDNAFKQFSVL